MKLSNYEYNEVKQLTDEEAAEAFAPSDLSTYDHIAKEGNIDIQLELTKEESAVILKLSDYGVSVANSQDLLSLDSIITKLKDHVRT